METSTFAWWKSVFDVAAVVFTALGVVAAGLGVYAGRELEQRRKAEEIEMRGRVDAAPKDADALRQRLAPRVLTPAQRAVIVARLRSIESEIDVVYPAESSRAPRSGPLVDEA